LHDAAAHYGRRALRQLAVLLRAVASGTSLA